MTRVMRVKVTLKIDGQECEIDRTISGVTEYDDVTQEQVMAFARELTDLNLASLGLRDHQTEHGIGPLTVRLNPVMPSNEALEQMFVTNGGIDARVDGLRAVWRNGCDAGMVAP